MSSHAHHHGSGHDHAHGHGHGHHHHHGPAVSSGRYGLAIGLNLAFVAVEVAAGVFAKSTALLADAGHNLSDVLGLAVAAAAAWFAARPASARRTFGFGKAPVLAALLNALVLMFASGALALEAIRRLAEPAVTQGPIVMAVAAAGVVVNGASALLFLGAARSDVNARGALLHLAADAAVSGAVIVAGGAIWLTGFSWIDPLTSLGVVAMIVWSTWGLMRDALNDALDAAPAHVDVGAVRAFLTAQAGVAAVHDLHVWRPTASSTALTAHLVAPDGVADGFTADVAEALRASFGIAHATLQVETAQTGSCPTC